ncbi:MAG: hypothetical protein MUF61_03170 [archaeon]|jgi:hypothetical protein|nr:hypothetical protein [archaeon]
MKLYHGSPKKLKVIRPRLARGMNKFENQKAVFLCKSFNHAALYAIGKTLKGKTIFAVAPRRLIIVGNYKPKQGYVYEVEAERYIRGARGQYAVKGMLIPARTFLINPKSYRKSIIHVENKGELLKRL